MIIWEYRIIQFGDCSQEVVDNRLRLMNEAGQEGWELASLGASGYIGVFKRVREN